MRTFDQCHKYILYLYLYLYLRACAQLCACVREFDCCCGVWGHAQGGAECTSLRAYEVVFDDGPEAGGAAPKFPSSETYWGCTLGPCTYGTGAALEGGLTERRGLTLKRLFRAIAPQSLENPLQNHISASVGPPATSATGAHGVALRVVLSAFASRCHWMK